MSSLDTFLAWPLWLGASFSCDSNFETRFIESNWNRAMVQWHVIVYGLLEIRIFKESGASTSSHVCTRKHKGSGMLLMIREKDVHFVIVLGDLVQGVIYFLLPLSLRRMVKICLDVLHPFLVVFVRRVDQFCYAMHLIVTLFISPCLMNGGLLDRIT